MIWASFNSSLHVFPGRAALAWDLNRCLTPFILSLDHCPVAPIPDDSLSLILEQEQLRLGNDLDFLFAMLALLLVALTLQSLKVHLEV